MANNIGKITQIIGAVLDIKFTEGNLPEINDAIRIPLKGEQSGKELRFPSIWAMIQSDVSQWDRPMD